MRAEKLNSPRILLGPQEISGYYQNLELGFLEIDVQARLVTTHPHPFGYTQAQKNPYFARVASNAVLKHRTSRYVAKLFWASLYFFASIGLVFWSLSRFDIYIFAWGTSFLPLNIDIPLYRLFNKKVIVVMGHGSEARPPYMSTPPHDGFPASATEIHQLQRQVRRVASSVRRNERFANRVIGMQMTAQFLTRDFIDFYRLGLPTPESQNVVIEQSQVQPQSGFVVLHVPSNKAVKGTEYIRETMAGITQKYADVEYRELSGVKHSQILEAMKSADVILDWLWSDIPMAVVGAEAAALGKPTIISSYGWPQWSRWEERCGGEFVPPVIRATPETLTEVVDTVLAQRKETVMLGVQAQAFTRTVWAPRQVASNYLRVIKGDLPEDWVLRPDQVDYLWGAGVSQEKVLTMVEALLTSGGSNPLRWIRGERLYRQAGIPKSVGGKI